MGPSKSPGTGNGIWAAVGVLAGIVVGLIVGAIAGVGLGAVASDASPVPSKPVPSPFPGDARYLQGVSVQILRDRMNTSDWRCETEAGQSYEHVKFRFSCTSSSSYANVSAYYDDDTHVRRLSSYCSTYSLSRDEAACQKLVSQVSSLVFSGHADQQGEAAAWVQANGRSNNAVTTIGRVDIRSSSGGMVSFSAAG